MRNLRNALFYIIIIGGFSLGVFLVIDLGKDQEVFKAIQMPSATDSTPWQQFVDTYHHNITHPLARLISQIITIIIVARIFGFLCRKIGQPSVVGEIAAGIFLGPSFVGAYFPEVSAFLFPPASLPNLQFLSQIGLILFMFIIGMELDLKVLRNKAHEAVVVSHASIIIPFALGVTLAYFIYVNFAPDHVPFHAFALFLGIAMSITAFPVLARIVQERNLTRTRLGAIVITCAAADDITAWCILAAVIAIVKAGNFQSALYTILISGIYVVIMLKLVRPFLKKVGDIYSNKETLSKPIVAIFFVTLLLSSYASEIIGIHALFGAFLAGVIMPPNTNFRAIFIEKIEDISLIMLLPLFFVFTGLRTQIGLLNDIELWKICGLIIAVAVTGKFFGSALAARFVGQTWRDSLSIGALMNTRGLMELVVLNIGYDLGILTPEVFAMMVIMALVTTCMTGPALDVINKIFPAPPAALTEVDVEKSKYRILLSFGNPLSGKAMLRLAFAFIRQSPSSASITALHLSPDDEDSHYNAAEYENESFEPIRGEAQQLNLSLVTLFKPASDIDREIINTANTGNFNMMIIGIGQSVFEGTLLGKLFGFTTKFIDPKKLYDTIITRQEKFFTPFDDRTRRIVRSTRIPVGIFIDKGFLHASKILVPVLSEKDDFLLSYIQRLVHNNQASSVIIADTEGITKKAAGIKEGIRMIDQTAPDKVILSTEIQQIDAKIFEGYDLVLISVESWSKALQKESSWLSHTPSVLIIKP
jgi:Kef-type K+ transport system membrane component KefB